MRLKLSLAGRRAQQSVRVHAAAGEQQLQAWGRGAQMPEVSTDRPLVSWASTSV